MGKFFFFPRGGEGFSQRRGERGRRGRREGEGVEVERGELLLLLLPSQYSLERPSVGPPAPAGGHEEYSFGLGSAGGDVGREGEGELFFFLGGGGAEVVSFLSKRAAFVISLALSLSFISLSPGPARPWRMRSRLRRRRARAGREAAEAGGARRRRSRLVFCHRTPSTMMEQRRRRQEALAHGGASKLRPAFDASVCRRRRSCRPLGAICSTSYGTRFASVWFFY